MLHDILDELVKLYAHHAPQLQPRPSASAAAAQAAAQASALAAAQGSSAGTSAAAAAADGADDIISPIEHMFDILEGSALVPLLEVCTTSIFSWRCFCVLRVIIMKPNFFFN